MSKSKGQPKSGGLTNKQFIDLYAYVKDPKNGWTDLGVSKPKPKKP